MPRSPSIWCFLNPYHGDRNFYVALCNALKGEVRYLELDPKGLENGVIDPFKLLPPPPYPDIAMSATTQIGTFALRALKIRHPKTVTVQFFKPRGSWKHLDLICSPPLPFDISDSKLVETTGVLTPINKDLLEGERKKTHHLSHLPSVAVLVGGQRKGLLEEIKKYKMYGLSDGMTDELCTNTLGLSQKYKLSIHLATSPRTSVGMTHQIQKRLKNIPHSVVWNWQDSDIKQNPYISFLAHASAIITTADSMSMISDACATSKPVFVFGLDEAMQEKSRLGFFKSLLSSGRIRPLCRQSELYTVPKAPFNEAQRLAEIIQTRFPLLEDQIKPLSPSAYRAQKELGASFP